MQSSNFNYIVKHVFFYNYKKNIGKPSIYLKWTKLDLIIYKNILSVLEHMIYIW
jgi:hypothetical protein